MDAIYGLSQMRGAHNAKRALLILSDGGDNHSRYNENDIKRLVKEADTQLYAIGLYDPLGYRKSYPEELNGPSLLAEITELTGGRVFAVEHLMICRTLRPRSAWSCATNMFSDTNQATTLTTPVGAKSRSSLRAPRGLPPLTAYSKTGYYDLPY